MGALALVLLPMLLAFGWSRTRPPSRGEDSVDAIVRSASRASLFGATLLLAARSSFVEDATLEAFANLGAGIAATSALVALARISGLGGALPVPAAARRLDLAWLSALLWALPTSMALAHAALPQLGISSRTIENASLAAGVGSFLVSLLASSRIHLLRRLELGAGDRSRAALTTLVLALLVAAAAALLALSPASWAFQTGMVASAVVVSSVCLARDPITVARTHRILVATTLAGAPVTLFAASIALRAPGLAGIAVLGTAIASVAIGLFARVAIQPIERDRARWLEAIERASAEALDASPERALRGALVALRDAAGRPELPPTLWRAIPAEVLHVDHAGYLHVRVGALPASVLLAAEQEPERTLRTEVLEALEVRRPDLRPALAFMREHEAFTATVLRLEEEVAGVLLLARGRRTTPLTLEEARALRVLTDRLASSLEVSSALARSRERELAERARADAEDDRARSLEHLIEMAGARYETDARRLARPALVATYSPASRLVVDELARLGALGVPFALLAPLGVDPVPYAAIAHLSGWRRSKPLVVVDGANAAEQALSNWQDPTASPLAAAEGGTLVVTSVEALPRETQAFLAHTLATRRSPSGRATALDLGLVVSVIEPLDALTRATRLVPELAARLGDRTLPLPSLGSRAEDLRALTLDRLAQLGIRLRGKPMGLDARALAKLVEHTWPGNEQELADVLSRAAAVARGDVVKGEDLERIGFVPMGEREPQTAETSGGAAPESRISRLPSAADR